MSKSALDPLDLFDVRSELNEEEAMVQETVGRFVDDRVIPLMREAFEKHEFPRHLIGEVAELGLLGSSIEGYDCAGMNSVSYGLICQELERGDSGLRSFASVQSGLVMYPILAFGNEEQKKHWLPRLARGEAIGCFGLTEPDFGSDPGGMITLLGLERERVNDAVEAANGTLVAQIRCESKANPGWTLQAESTDGGRTWSEPHPICYGLPSHLLRLRDGREVTARQELSNMQIAPEQMPSPTATRRMPRGAATSRRTW